MTDPRDSDTWLAEQRCVQLLHRYATAVDRVDLDLLRTCFVDDVQADYMGTPKHGIQSIVEMIGNLSRLRGTIHNLGPVLATLTDSGATVTAGCLVLAVSEAAGEVGAHGVLRGVRYTCDLELRSGDWRITTLTHSVLWATAAPESGLTGEPLGR